MKSDRPEDKTRLSVVKLKLFKEGVPPELLKEYEDAVYKQGIAIIEILEIIKPKLF